MGNIKINYQKKLEEAISELKGSVPKLALHCCCAPCSSYCIEYLSDYFSITSIYYNPNISPKEEYLKREGELNRLIKLMPAKNPVDFKSYGYAPEEFYSKVKYLESEPEGGKRCFKCYELRLGKAAEYAAENKYDYFCSTLTISPLKDAQKINEIGEKLAAKYSVKFLPSDFKKRNGYKRSIELSKEYGLYRQNFCGCVFSKTKKTGEI